MSAVRARYVRELVDALERAHGREAVSATFDKLRARLSTLSSLDDLGVLAPSDVVWLADAEELLFGFDAALGDGSGKLLEDVAFQHFARLVSSGGLLVPGDLMGSVARLRAPLEHFFDESPMGFDIAKSRSGFMMFLGIGGRPRTARLLRHIATGAVRAVQRYAREGMVEDVKIVGEAMGDRVRLDVRLRDPLAPGVFTSSSPAVPGARLPGGRRPSRPHLPTTKPTLEAVERIIRRSTYPEQTNPDEIVSTRHPRVGSASGSDRVSGPPSVPGSEQPPRSDTLPSARFPSGFIKKTDGEPESGSG